MTKVFELSYTVLCFSVGVIVQVPGLSMCFDNSVSCIVGGSTRSVFDPGGMGSETVPYPGHHKWFIERYPKFHLKCTGI